MPWKYVAIIILLIILIVFIGLNLGNNATISFGFAELKDIPVYFLILIFFSLGALVTMPISFISRQKLRFKKKKKAESKRIKDEEKDSKNGKKQKKLENNSTNGEQDVHKK